MRQPCPMCADGDDPGQMIWPSTGCLTRCDVCDGNEWIEVADDESDDAA